MGNDRQATEDERGLQDRVALLAQEMAEAINGGRVEDRELLREFAVNLVRDQVRVEAVGTAMEGAGSGTFNAIGLGIPLVLMGSVLIFLFPLVGLAMLSTAGLLIAWSVAATMFVPHRKSE